VVQRRRIPLTVDVAVLAVAFAAAIAWGGLQQEPEAPAGSLERVTVHGTSLEGNLSGDSADRTAIVYLPPDYATRTGQRYPVVYFLHGTGMSAASLASALSLPGSIDRAIAASGRELIVVIPDASTAHADSMYSDSPALGDWETFIANELPAFVDARYRTVASRDGRGLAGHSRGGYGTIRVGIAQPAAFAALYAMSSCCLTNEAVAGHVAALASMRAVALDVGDRDPLADISRHFDEALTRLGVPHTLDVYEGDHTNQVRLRFETVVLPFFVRQLTPAR
jgi:enterochelin esterase-like enzyme